jgi:hypothetical protein
VSERITLEDLKTHPGFTLDIADLNYIPPSPVPIPPMREPVDPASVDETKLLMLKSLGYRSDPEIFDELKSDESTSAKVLCQIADMKTKGIEVFAWRDSANNIVAQKELFANSPDVEEGEPFIIKDVELRFEAAFAALQALFTENGIQWFHPTPDEIVIGNVELGFFVIVRARDLRPSVIEISVRKVKGDQNLMDEWCRKIQERLGSKKDAQ